VDLDISPGPCGDTTGALERCTRPAEYVICTNADIDWGVRACGRHLLSRMRDEVQDMTDPYVLTVHVLPEGRRRANA
jgi:hypothetical protein